VIAAQKGRLFWCAAAITVRDQRRSQMPVTGDTLICMNDRITFRLGPLTAALAAYCEKQGTTPSDVIREALAAKLRVGAPDMVTGNPAIGEHAKAGAAARWKRKAKKRKGSGSGTG